MKLLGITICCILCHPIFSQTLQLHYDARHSIDPKYNAKNFPTLYFEYFKNQDSVKSFIKPGSFLLKMQADFLGDKGNMGNFYMQVSQSFKFWKPNIYLNIQYSGGLGITEPKQYSYYISNTFSAGLAYPFKWGNAYLASVIELKYRPYNKPSYDGLFTQYWWKGLWNYKAEFSGDFSIWTENRNHGDITTINLHGKRFFFFAEPQFWYNINSVFAFGTKLFIYYHIITYDNVLQFYPTIAIRCKL
jgi:hypothetical protein